MDSEVCGVAAEWDVGAPGISVTIASAYQVMTHCTQLKFGGLCEWPLVVWSLRDPDVAAHVLENYDKADEATKQKKHRLEHYFCSPEGMWRIDMEKHAARESFPKTLQDAFNRYSWCRLDEVPAEASHKEVHEIISGATNPREVWWSATASIHENFTIYDDWTARGLKGKFLEFFGHYKSILQTKKWKSTQLVDVRMVRSKVLDIIYNTDAVSLSDWSAFKGIYNSFGPRNQQTASGHVMAVKIDFLKAVLLPGERFTLEKIQSHSLDDQAPAVEQVVRQLEATPVADSRSQLAQGDEAANVSYFVVVAMNPGNKKHLLQL
jgi:hypothetical protein